MCSSALRGGHSDLTESSLQGLEEKLALQVQIHHKIYGWPWKKKGNLELLVVFSILLSKSPKWCIVGA